MFYQWNLNQIQKYLLLDTSYPYEFSTQSLQQSFSLFCYSNNLIGSGSSKKTPISTNASTLAVGHFPRVIVVLISTMEISSFLIWQTRHIPLRTLFWLPHSPHSRELHSWNEVITTRVQRHSLRDRQSW